MSDAGSAGGGNGRGHGGPSGPGDPNSPGGAYGGPSRPAAPGSFSAQGAPGGNERYGGPVSPGHDGPARAGQVPPGHGPGGPGGPGPGNPGTGAAPGPAGPGAGGPGPSRARPWALIAVALGCVAVLVIAIGGGLTALILTRNSGEGSPPVAASQDPTTSEEPTAEEPTPAEGTPSFEVVVPYDEVPGSPEEIHDILADNPLTRGTLPTVGSCELPATPASTQSPEEIQAVLDAGGGCLNSIWSTASSDRGLPWNSPSVTVYTPPEVPDSASCDPESFDPDSARMCNLDSTLYWPAGSGIGAEIADAENVPSTYLWDLAVAEVSTVNWNSSVGIYYVSMLNKIAEQEADGEESEAYKEATRRYSLQKLCLGSAAAMQVPSSAEPTTAVRAWLTDEANWKDDGLDPASRVHWIQAGLTSGGDLSACNTWEAPADLVA
ncbi:hypothetical protein [Brachybacterium fresconis]|uniref:Uncharacterized protein n=1 Tax=Brachybacterium fresconis TaxID=173363 RepID=A0ABS4YK79_9MICO|nr:hypothetical protein [Brachybacterium fresconis]MBP2409154.1 hypothetical protein [Brachybacterium fresconis]